MADYELVVIGAGATGLGAARSARRAGRRVALVEAARPGGDCTHFGCVPSKAMLETARRVHAARNGEAYGFTAAPQVDFAAVMRRVHAVIADIERDESPELLATQGIDLLADWGVVTGPTSIDVGGRSVSFEKLVVASGSRAFVPPIDGLADVPYLDNTTIFSLTEQPEHLVVLGGGPIGVELSQAFRRLGSRVTIVEGGAALLGREEPEAQVAVTAALEHEGVTVRTGVKAVRVDAGGSNPVLHLSDGTSIVGSHLLVAVGRTPSTDGFGLEKAGVALEKGRIVTDSHLRAADTVWAAGDCTSKLQFTHVGDEQGRMAARNAFAGSAPWKRGTWDDRVVPWVTFTEPEVGHVGLTEQQAFEQYGERAMVATAWDRHGDRARTAGETGGFVKLIAVPGPVGGMATGRLVGMTAGGPMAGELLAEGALSMRSKGLVGRMAQTIHADPTWSLTPRYAAAAFFGRGREAARPARGPA